MGSIPRPIEHLPASKDLLLKLSQQSQKRDASASKGASTVHSSPAPSSVQSPISGAKRGSHVRTNAELQFLPSQVPIGKSRSFGANNTSTINISSKGPSMQNMSLSLGRDAGRVNADDLRAAMWKKKDHPADLSAGNSKSLNGAWGAGSTSQMKDERSPGKIHDLTFKSKRSTGHDSLDTYSLSQAAQDQGKNVFTEAVSSNFEQKLDHEKPRDNGSLGSGNQSSEVDQNVVASIPSQRPRSGKITMRDIKMPKDQEYLLEQPYCEFS